MEMPMPQGQYGIKKLSGCVREINLQDGCASSATAGQFMGTHGMIYGAGTSAFSLN